MRKVTFGINITIDGYCGHESALAEIRSSRSFAYTQILLFRGQGYDLPTSIKDMSGLLV
ncbi:MAG: hypothetical protein KF758_15315 [Anaerolineales bacterium]|nr:hypothetical protein [Anaerolineales bacterium]MBX3038280.1 hypothetical protein [Anaerolineales bacterium]